MEEIVENREQPFLSEQAKNGIVEKKDIEVASTSQPEGSQFGKFSCAEDLVNAYNNLQAEFTRKCQKLSEIQKEIAEKENEETSLKKDETKNISPAFENENWRSLVANFLQENEKAREFSRDISNEILKDKDLQNSPNMLDIAWGRVLAKNYKTPEQIAKESCFMDKYVLNNEEIKKQIFNNYLEQIKKSPQVIGNEIKGGISLFNKKTKPTNLNDAKSLAIKFFK